MWSKSLRNHYSSHSNYYDKYAKATLSISNTSNSPISVNLNLRLEDLLRLEKLQSLTGGTIAEIWRKRFERKPFTTGLAMAGSPFSLWWSNRACESPIGTICNFMVQHMASKTGGCAVFTTLDDFQRYQESAPVRMVSNCFGDLLDSKDIGLIQTQFDGELISRAQANVLLQSCINSYTTDAAYQWVRTFNKEPGQFDFPSFLNFFYQRII